jgi:hypothetical protein
MVRSSEEYFGALLFVLSVKINNTALRGEPRSKQQLPIIVTSPEVVAIAINLTEPLNVSNNLFN